MTDVGVWVMCNSGSSENSHAIPHCCPSFGVCGCHGHMVSCGDKPKQFNPHQLICQRRTAVQVDKSSAAVSLCVAAAYEPNVLHKEVD